MLQHKCFYETNCFLLGFTAAYYFNLLADSNLAPGYLAFVCHPEERRNVCATLKAVSGLIHDRFMA